MLDRVRVILQPTVARLCANLVAIGIARERRGHFERLLRLLNPLITSFDTSYTSGASHSGSMVRVMCRSLQLQGYVQSSLQSTLLANGWVDSSDRKRS
jgi:hypothetical protein